MPVRSVMRRWTPAKATDTCGAFARREDGALVIFSLFLLAAMLLMTGLAVDVLRSEVARTKLQNTLDRAVLAAADLDQTLDPEAVVEDYFDKIGLRDYLSDVDVDGGLNYRTVTAEANVALQTLFLRQVGITEIDTPAVGTANETVRNVEISMVLDISGSMRFDDRITPLRAAAKEFVDMTLLGDRAEGTTISIVPYAGQVNPGPGLFSLIGGDRDHNHSSCVFVEEDDFDHTGLPEESERQVPHFMNWTIAASYMDWGWCPSDDARIQPHSNNALALKDFITNMRLHDGTGTHIGMKWGVAMLDPTTRDALDTLRTVGQVPESTENRPLDWNAANSAKFIVLMTDGNITEQVEPKFTGLRDIDDDDDDNEANDADSIDGIDHDLLNSVQALNDQRDTEGRKNTYKKTVSQRNRNLQSFYAMCNAAKAKGVVIYTIAFEANANATEEMRNCASTTANFFEVDQLEIGAAFNSIARQINQLRLTH